MTEYLSRKLKVLSALLILMVVYIHTYYKEGESMNTLKIIESIIGRRICSVAVPLFYVISGYLFFLKVPDGLRSIGQKLRKRVRTLLIPYLIANALTFLFIVGMSFLESNWPDISLIWNYPHNGAFLNSDWGHILYIIFIAPVAYQLWFIRNLMFVLLFTPIVYLILRWIKTSQILQSIFIFILAGIYLLFHAYKLQVAFTWFYIGAFFAICHPNYVINSHPRQYVSILLTIIFLGYCILSGLHLLGGSPNYGPVLGIPALWLLYDVVANRWQKLITTKTTTFLCSYTFFVYLCHEPLLNIFKKVPLLISNAEGYLITLYLLLPPLFYILASLLGAGLKRAFPKAYAVYTGGR